MGLIEKWTQRAIESGSKRDLERVRQQGARASEKVADFVLKHSHKKPDSVWHEWGITDYTGRQLTIQVANVNNCRSLQDILKNGNPNDRIEVLLTQVRQEDVGINSSWRLPQQELHWLRGYPSKGVPPPWDTYTDIARVPPLDQQMIAYRAYAAFMERVQLSIDQSTRTQLDLQQVFLTQAGQ